MEGPLVEGEVMLYQGKVFRKTCPTRDKVVIQVSDPFSFTRSTALCSELGKSSQISSASVDVLA